jgi:hypothetical protein
LRYFLLFFLVVGLECPAIGSIPCDIHPTMAAKAWVECLCKLDGVCARKENAWVAKIADALVRNECCQPDEIVGLCLDDALFDLKELDAVFAY